MRRAAGGEAGQDPWGAAIGNGAPGGAAELPARAAGEPGARSGRWPLLALLGRPPALRPRPAPCLSALGPHRRKLLAAGEEALARWFPAWLGKPAGTPTSVYSPLGLESGLCGSLGLLLEGFGIGADLILEEQLAPSHKQNVRRNYFTRVRTPFSDLSSGLRCWTLGFG